MKHSQTNKNTDTSPASSAAKALPVLRRLRTMMSWSGGFLVFSAIAAVIIVCPGLFKRARWEPLLKRLCRAMLWVFG